MCESLLLRMFVAVVLVSMITRLKDSDGRLLYRRPAGVTVHGKLKENGEEVGSFVAYRYSQKTGKFDGFKGTCARLGRGLDVLSRDIVIWLRNPTQNARLGDL